MARKAAKLPKASEEQIHIAVAQHLALIGKRGLLWFHVPNGGSRNKIEAAKLKRMGVKPGVPDLMFIDGGKTYGLELKTEVGRVSIDQSHMLHMLDLAGATVAVAYGLDDALRILSGWGLINHPVSKQEPPHADGKRRGGHRARVSGGRSKGSRSQRAALLVQA